MRNDDGDEVVDPPEKWIEAEEDETLDERLADEEPDVGPGRASTRAMPTTPTKATSS